jgi:ATP-dependent helicase/nuclease subunit A
MMSPWEKILATLADEQKTAATARGNTVVSAGAGSGKTRVLAVRYLYLVKELGMHPSRIACLTFTNKASAEMQERIRGMLEDCAREDPVFADALAAFPQSCVTTLDSLCSEIARNASARWGIPPDFAIDQQAARDETRAVALEYLLKRRTEPVPARFIAANGFEGAVEALCSLATGRDGLMGPAELAFDPESQSRKLGFAVEALHLAITSAMEAGRGLDSGTAKGPKSWVDAAEAWPDEAPDPADPAALSTAADRYRSLAAMQKPRGTTPAAHYFNPACDSIKQQATAAFLACQALADPDRGAALGFARDFILAAREKRAASGMLQFQDVAAMAREALLRDSALRTWYKARFDAVMVDEFQDDNELQKDILYLLAEKRSRIPAGNGSGTTSAGSGPDDTTVPGPADLEPGVLFFVGDEKQSIYLFRNADVKVFRGLADELATTAVNATTDTTTQTTATTTITTSGHGGQDSSACLNLSTNWRSEPELIEFFNQTFSRIMPAPDDLAARDYEARFAGLLAGPATPGVQACVTWMEAPKAQGEQGTGDSASLGALEAQAWQVAQLIRELVDGKVPITAKGASGKEALPCRYEDIAILFRATAAQNTYERYLRIFGIPYTATATAGLYVESILGDLYAILRLVAFPDDRLALASVLRGPFARLSDEACFVILERSRDQGFSLAIPGIPEPTGLPETSGLPPPPGLLADLQEADAQKARTMLETWTWLRSSADRLSLAELVSALWYERGLRWNVLRNPDNTAYLEHFDFAWSLAADADARGLRLCDFIASLEPLIGEVKKVEDVSVVRESARGVSVMTVHASKGLEFPVVIVPGAENTGRGDRQEAIAMNERLRPSIRLMDDQGHTVDPVYQMEKTMDAMERTVGDTVMDEDLAETVRLFYVACTRAVSRLYLCAKAPHNEDKKGKSFRGLFLRAWPEIEAGTMAAALSVPGTSSSAATAVTTVTSVTATESAKPGRILPDWLILEPIPDRTVTDYARLVRSGSTKPDGAAAAATFLADAPAPALPVRRARWAVTAAAETLATAAEAQTASTGAFAASTESQAASTEAPASSAAGSAPPDEAMSQAAEEGFGEDSFGTLCHELTESLLLHPDREPEAGPGSTHKLSRLSATTRAAILAEALSLARGFTGSPRGLAAAAARDALAAGQAGAVFSLEYGFTWQGQAGSRPVFLNGSMDLVYGDAHGVCVVDFKTDRLIRPERHAFQLGVYRESARSIFGVPAQAILYYLRSGEEREINLVPDASALDTGTLHTGVTGCFSANQASYV